MVYTVLSAADAGGGNTALTLDRTAPATGSYTLYRPIPMTVEWMPRRANNPGEIKQWPTVTLKAETQVARKVDFYFATEIDRKREPFDQDWSGTLYGISGESAQSRQIVTSSYVSSDGKQASATRNDCFNTGATNTLVPNNTITAYVPPEYSFGEHISVRIYNTQAACRFGPKALSIETRTTNSTRGRQ